MNSTLAALPGRWLAYQPLLGMAQAVFWPSRLFASAWLLTLGAGLIGILTKAGAPLIFALFGLVGVHLSIPIQISTLSRKKSWLLLPGFQPLVLHLLLLLLLLWLVIATLLLLQSPQPNWLALPYLAFGFSLVILPSIYVRHLWPLLLEMVIFIACLKNPAITAWLATHVAEPWLVSAVIASTLLMWGWMKLRWLHPAQRAVADAKRTSVFALSGLELPWLMRLTRQSASLEGSLLLGDGDSWHASVIRAAWATWLTPAVMLVIGLLFAGSKKSFQPLWLDQSFLVLLTLAPLFTLSVQQLKSTQRLGRCWLFLAAPRQAMYGFVERVFFKELAAYLAMTLSLMLVLVPYPMILPLLCYGASVTLLLSYLIFALVKQHYGWSIGANLLILLIMLVAMDFLWATPQLVYLSSLALVLPVYSLRRYGKASWLKLDYSQLKPRQLL